MSQFFRYSTYLSPGNILENYYITKNDNSTYSLKYGLYETILEDEPQITNVENKIKSEISKLEKKGYELRSKANGLNQNDIEKLFKIKINEKEIQKDNISTYSSANYDYYIYDLNKINNGELYTHRYIMFFNKELKEYVGRFTISMVGDDISLGSIFISNSRQRQGHFTNVINYDIKTFLPKNTNSINVYAILRKGLGFYKKLQKQGRFTFTKQEKDGILYL